MRTEVAYDLKRRCKHALRPEAAKKQVLLEALSLLANDSETLRGTSTHEGFAIRLSTTVECQNLNIGPPREPWEP